MSWQKRLRDMALAGGTMATAACGGTVASSSFPDASAGGDVDGGADASDDVPMASTCCNANPDPCCTYVACGSPLTALCQRELDCQADGGTWNPYQSTCFIRSVPEAGRDAGDADVTVPDGDVGDGAIGGEADGDAQD